MHSWFSDCFWYVADMWLAKLRAYKRCLSAKYFYFKNVQIRSDIAWTMKLPIAGQMQTILGLRGVEIVWIRSMIPRWIQSRDMILMDPIMIRLFRGSLELRGHRCYSRNTWPFFKHNLNTEHIYNIRMVFNSPQPYESTELKVSDLHTVQFVPNSWITPNCW